MRALSVLIDFEGVLPAIDVHEPRVRRDWH